MRPSSALRGRALFALVSVGLLAVVGTACRSFPEDSPGLHWPRPRAGVVVSEHPDATEAGVRILDLGGTAADAAVATALALAVVYPQAGNLGGGGFAIWAPHEGEPLALDFRETAPARLSADAFLEGGEPVRWRLLASHLASGVPGSPAGLYELHARCGRLPFGVVAAPAIDLARRGFEVDAWLARDLADPDVREQLAQPYARALFYPGGAPPREGDLLVNEDLARTLETLVREGPSGFYEGAVANLIVAEMERGGGLVDHADLVAYEAQWREPLRGWFRGKEVISMPPPSSGGIVLLQMLAILDGLPLDGARHAALASEPDGVGLSERAVHWWIEALRMAFADRAVHMGDPDFGDVPVRRLLAPQWIAERRVAIGERANPDVAAWVPAAEVESAQTTHLSVIDAEGNAVSLTTTLNLGFGSGIAVPGAGFLLNNEIDDFAVQPGVPNAFGLVGSGANAIEGGKRPLSSMTPTVVRDQGRAVTLVIGSPGGPRIITAVLEVMLRTLVYEQSLAAAILAPRLHQQWKPPVTFVEPGWDTALLERLRARGHELEESPTRWSSVQAIELEPGGLPVGVSDPRRGGNAQVQGRTPTWPARPGAQDE